MAGLWVGQWAQLGMCDVGRGSTQSVPPLLRDCTQLGSATGGPERYEYRGQPKSAAARHACPIAPGARPPQASAYMCPRRLPRQGPAARAAGQRNGWALPNGLNGLARWAGGPAASPGWAPAHQLAPTCSMQPSAVQCSCAVRTRAVGSGAGAPARAQNIPPGLRF